MNKVLITGGAGFIGSNLAKILKNDFDVYILDNYRTGKKENIEFLKPEKVFNENILDTTKITEIIKEYKFEYIIHLAALVSVAESIEAPLISQEINSIANLKLLEIIRKHNNGIKKFVFASSAAVFGNLPDLPKTNQSPVMPLTPYAIDKYYGERTTLNYYNLYNIPTVALRFFNVFGPNQDPSSQYSGVISKIFEAFEKNKSFTFYGDGEQTRDFVYVYDVVEAIKILMLNKTTNGKVYNIGTGNYTNLINVFKIVESLYGKPISYDFKDERQGDIKHSYANIDELKELGFNPKFNIQNALKNYYNYKGN
ncbi:NAD-dependent epimerase/dehydratase family protein [Staphylococcus sp. GDX8P47P]|uniref:NAD-dependent epimerase/dehydratase family protein n=1 Tax=Staphylococcus TaxID=1279 RepID=UPI001AEBDB53|nr:MULTISPECIES: NAD-dependent epimerase/dehydratase family protein [Staphylococcus]